MIWIFLSVIFIILIIIMLTAVNDGKNDVRVYPIGVGVIYMLSVSVVIFMALYLFPNEPLINNNVPFVYMFISAGLIFIPLLIRRYSQTLYYPDKDVIYFRVFLFASLIGLTGLFIYIRNIGLLGRLLPFCCVVSILVIFLPIFICMYYRNKGRK